LQKFFPKKQKAKNMTNETSKLNTVAIFGGSFDPVQKAHIAIAKRLQERFGRVVVVPSFVSPFKKGGAYTEPKFRLDMLKVSLPEGVDISEYELNKGDISYTIDTVRYFANELKGQELYLCIGSDNLKKLHKWFEFDELKKLVTFFVIEREGFEIKKTTINRLNKKYEARVKVADFTGGGESSAMARLDIAFDNFTLVPAAAKKIIQKNNLYKDFSFVVDSFKDFNLSDDRIAHIYGTAKTVVNLAKKYNANIFDLTIAALLHDITKETALEKIDSMGVETGEFKYLPRKIVHAFTASAIAKPIFNIKKKAIIDAVRYHTTGAPKMGKLAKLLFIADFIEPNRDGELYADIRQEVKDEPRINRAVLKILQTKIAHVKAKGNTVHALTLEAADFYKKLLAPKIKIETAEDIINTAIFEDDGLLELQKANAGISCNICEEPLQDESDECGSCAPIGTSIERPQNLSVQELLNHAAKLSLPQKDEKLILSTNEKVKEITHDKSPELGFENKKEITFDNKQELKFEPKQELQFENKKKLEHSPLKQIAVDIPKQLTATQTIRNKNNDSQMYKDKSHLAFKIAKILNEKKARDIVLINLEEKTIIADYFVICSAFSTTAVKALVDIVDEKLSKDLSIEPLRRDVDRNWAAIDYGSVILHVQLEETREFYNLERLWADESNVIKI